VYDKLVAAAVSTSRRIGAMPCPTCAQPIGVPTAGMRGFPVDTKISRIKDLVINEMAQNISKKINGEAVFSDTASTNSGYSTKSADFNSTRNRRDHSYDNMAQRKEEPEEEIGGYKRNPTSYPDFGKFARYFDHEGKIAEPLQFQPTIKPDRHRVGYSNSFQHRRHRRVVVRTRAYDDTGDLFEPQPR